MVNVCVAALVLASSLAASPMPRTQSGIAMHYYPHRMERVVKVRAKQGYRVRHDVAGYAAVNDCGMVGRVVMASINGRRAERFQVMDCSHPRDAARHRRMGLVIEVDWKSAVRNGFSRQGRATARVWRME